MKKKLLSILTVCTLGLTMFAGCGTSTDSKNDSKKADDGKVTIGVSIWGTSDPLGSQVKNILDTAAKALDVNLIYSETNLQSEQVVASVENLCVAGVDGIVICNSADTEMAQIIPVIQKNKVYLAQFFRKLTSDDVIQVGVKNSYYVGSTSESEEDNGYKLGNILIKEKNRRNLGIISYRVGDATAAARMSGYYKAIDEWNQANKDDQVKIMDLVDDKMTAEDARQAVEGLINTNPNLDGIISVGGGSPLEGIIAGINAKGLTGKIAVSSTDFPEDLDKKLEKGEVSTMSGGHYADPYFSFMMVYNAIKGNYQRPENEFYKIAFPFLTVSSPEDYLKYDKYFVKSLPYTNDEIVKMSTISFDELKQTAANLSIDDVAKRHSN